MIKPKRLKKGDIIGIVTPASPIDRSRLRRGVETLQRWGYKVKIHPSVYNRRGYLAGDDYSRAQALNEMFADPVVKALFCGRGGYGSVRILPYIDYPNIKSHPKVLLGYSDITCLHLAIYKKTRLVTFLGPMVQTELSKRMPVYNRDSLLGALTDRRSKLSLTNPKSMGSWRVLRKGIAEGVLLGGNLTLVAMLVGTPYLPELKGKILFIEDIDEEPSSIDGMLFQLKLADVLDQISGLVIGQFTDCTPTKSGRPSLSIMQILRDVLEGGDYPVIYNFACGHGRYTSTLPLGVKARIDTEKRTFMLVESGVI
jgi:muramoyltetrapeptide carboxypeptidase